MVKPEARSAEDTETRAESRRAVRQALLHQRLDPRRILKRLLRAHESLGASGLHQRLDPRRILKLGDGPLEDLAARQLHQRLDPRRILKLERGWNVVTLGERYTRGSIRGGY